MAMDGQRLSRAWVFKLEASDWLTFKPPRAGNHRVVVVTHVFLVDPASAGGQGVVHARIKIGTLRVTLASLSAESPRTELPSPMVLDQEFTLYVVGSEEIVVQFEGYCRHEDEEAEPPLTPEAADGRTEGEVEAPSSEDDDDNDADTDDTDEEEYSSEEEEEEEEEEERHGEVDGQASMASSSAGGRFLGGPAVRFASAGSTAGFMRVAAVESPENGDNCDKQISVLYRCTHFSPASDGGVQVRESTTVYQFRFVVPPAGDTARSLQRVGASLAPLVYPDRFHKRLQRLWSSLTAEVSVPAHATPVEVLVDFGILHTRKRVEHIRAALEATMVGKDSHPELHLELRLPEPAQCGAREDCPVCLELLEGDDLAAWPGCSKPHVFHGVCLELVLRKSYKCPLCRNLWFIEPKPL